MSINHVRDIDMNYIDVIPQALSVFAQAIDTNQSVRGIGSGDLHDAMCCRFILDVSAIYDGPPCQWSCEIGVEKGTSAITFKPCDPQ